MAMLPQPMNLSRPVLNGVHLPPPSARAMRFKAAVTTSSGTPAQAPGPRCPATRIGHARQSSETKSQHARTRCAAAETATELVSATERFVEEFQAAEQCTELERTGHLVSLEEQLQAVRLKVCLRASAHLCSNARRCLCFIFVAQRGLTSGVHLVRGCANAASCAR